MAPFASLQAGQIARELARVQGGQHGYANRNSRYYPCLSGEALPPTFTLGGSGTLPSYAAGPSGRPAIHLAGGTGAGSGTVTWPRVPRISVDALTTLTHRWQVNAGAWTTSAASYFALTQGSFEFRKALDSPFWKVLTPAGATITTVTATTGIWFDLKTVFTPTEVRFYIDGVLVHTNTVNYLSVTATTSPPTALVSFGGADNSISIDVGMFETSWSA